MKQKVIIFGAGNAGMAAKNNLHSDYQIIAFCDNDPQKSGLEIDGIPIVSVKELHNLNYDVIMIASEYFEQIETQLKQQENIAEKKIKVLHATAMKRFHFGDSDLTKQVCEEVLLALCDALTESGIKYYVDAGTLLGIYRDDAFIPWDDDFDIAVLRDDIEKIRSNQGTLLTALERVSNQPWKITEYYAEQAFGLVKAGDTRSFKLEPTDANCQLPLIDLFVKYVDQHVMDYVIASRGFSMPSRHMLQLASFTFRDKSIFIPSDVEGYLSRHYGDWQTPKSDWTLDDIQSSTLYDEKTL
ncbi:LicD family protein [Aliiglaciecola sp. 3_MG-2023]|uniref:LicD family protein n=1 Tax=Aliiglaciecola sp. 3_MG-2023 TaxID=3062644 RepID=UPI0026E39300|nr:LicD family protein [Aliiglaciecola sp. 3_MG-2023]MDO6691739.1 LicD family protein [Aliiglaciecola sp. 3_MG-2023]